MHNGTKIKIVLFAYHTSSVLTQYWRALKDKSDCCWVTFSPSIFKELKQGGHQNVVFRDIAGPSFRPAFLCAMIKKIKAYFCKNLYPRLIKKTLDEIDPDIIITNVTLPLLGYASRAMKVQVFHSVCYKKYVMIPETLEHDLILLAGQLYKDELCKRFTVKNPDKLRVVGWPRVDDFVSNKYTAEDRSKFMNMLGLDPTLKNVLYAPTWSAFYKRGMFPRSFGEVTDAFEEFCRRLKPLNINLIIRLHSINSKLASNPALHRIADKYGVCFYRQLRSEYFDNLGELFLWSSDVLISDVSGIIPDYLVLNRPIVYIEPETERVSWEHSDLPKEYRAGVVATTMHELVEGVRRGLNDPGEFDAQRRKIMHKIFYKLDGRSSLRAAETVLNYYRETFSPQRSRIIQDAVA